MRVSLLMIFLLITGSVVGGIMARSKVHRGNNLFGPISEGDEFDPATIAEWFTQAAEKLPVAKLMTDEKYVFGVMQRDGNGEHVFPIKNLGDAPLTLEVTSSTCKCTIGELDNSTIAPGETANLKLTWTANSSEPEFSQSATVRTNDPRNGELRLSVSGRLVDPVYIHPPRAELGDIASGEPLNMELTLFNFNDEPIILTGADFAEPSVQELATVEWEELSREDLKFPFEHARQVFRVQASLRHGIRQGIVRHRFRIRYTNDKQTDDVTVLETLIEAQIVGPLQLRGGSKLEKTDEAGGYRYKFGHLRVGEGQEERVNLVIRGDDNANLTIRVAEVVPDNVFEASIGKENTLGAIRTIPITLRVREDAPAIKLDGLTRDRRGWILLEPVDSTLAPLKLWLNIDISDD